LHISILFSGSVTWYSSISERDFNLFFRTVHTSVADAEVGVGVGPPWATESGVSPPLFDYGPPTVPSWAAESGDCPPSFEVSSVTVESVAGLAT
jgi:hypothetical protein